MKFAPEPLPSSPSSLFNPTKPHDKDWAINMGGVDNILGKLPAPARTWVESLSWQQRRYMLSLCHLICAAPAEVQAEFLDDYTADGLVTRKLEDQETKLRVKQYLKDFHIETELTETVLRDYIRQFYTHSAQDTRRQPDLYLQSALKLVFNTEERNNVFSYILGFELLKSYIEFSVIRKSSLTLTLSQFSTLTGLTESLYRGMKACFLPSATILFKRQTFR